MLNWTSRSMCSSLLQWSPAMLHDLQETRKLHVIGHFRSSPGLISARAESRVRSACPLRSGHRAVDFVTFLRPLRSVPLQQKWSAQVTAQSPLRANRGTTHFGQRGQSMSVLTRPGETVPNRGESRQRASVSSRDTAVPKTRRATLPARTRQLTRSAVQGETEGELASWPNIVWNSPIVGAR